MHTRWFAIGGGLAALGIAAVVAATMVVVTPSNTQGWSTADTTAAGGSVTFVSDSTAPAGIGALRLTTDATITAKAQYLHPATTPLTSVTELSYFTKQNAPVGLVADPAYQLITFLNGGTSGFTTLVFEPYQGGLGPIMSGAWQSWDVDTGRFWSTRTVTCSNGIINGTPGGPATYTLAQIQSICPSAVVAAFGVNIGSNNPSYDVEADLVDFNGTIYNFEPYQVVTDKDACKDGGWQTMRRADGTTFRNQGDCNQYVNTGR